MTEIKNTEILTDEIKQELEIYQALKPFLARCLDLNHDINNPLTGIIGFCEFLMEDADSFNDEQNEFISNIVTCSEKIQKHVEELCDTKIAMNEKIDLKSFIEKNR